MKTLTYYQVIEYMSEHPDFTRKVIECKTFEEAMKHAILAYNLQSGYCYRIDKVVITQKIGIVI